MIRPTTPRDYEHHAFACPSCEAMLDMSTAVFSMGGTPPRGPETGDITLCFECGDVLLYADGADGLTARWPTPEEWAAWAASAPDLLAHIRGVQCRIWAGQGRRR